jgi:16S rRNA processing protein RimM
MELEQAGYFSKTHGVKGQLLLRLEKELYPEELKALFIETATGKAPYFVKELKETAQGLIIGLEELNTVEQARPLIGKAVYVPADLIAEEEEADDWTGYELVDRHFGTLGPVTGTSDNGEQVLLSLQYRGKEVLLPLVEDFVERVDEENRVLYFHAPEGLIGLYLEEPE